MRVTCFKFLQHTFFHMIDKSILYQEQFQYNLSFLVMQGKKIQQIHYQITPEDQTVHFKVIDGSKMYDKKLNGSFIRKAIYKQPPPVTSEQFNDPQFKLLSQIKQYKYVRLYDLYNQQVPLFPEDQQFSSFIEPQQSYNSFMAESGLISYDYLRTLFITQTINKRGFYLYFVKKDGDYFLQYCDDIIPLEKKTNKPFWNLSPKHPWQLLLLKVWLKHCGSFQNLFKAEPFALLETFGLPEYQVFNFRKQLHFLKNQQVSNQKRKQNIKYFAMNKSDVIILAKTIDSQQVVKVGLVPNFAAYRVLRITKPDQISLFRIYSTLPCYWVGSYSPVLNTQLNKIYNYQMYLDLQRNILLSQEQLIRYFNKFYVVPFQLSEPDMLLTQDCVNLSVYKNKPTWLSFEVKQGSGMIGISIQLPKIRNEIGRFPQFRYFLSKNVNYQRVSRSRGFSILTQQEENNLLISSSCFKWQCYRIDYVQGYHHNACFFCKADPGVYVMFIDAELDGPINVRFDSFLPITRPEIYFPSQSEIKQIFDSTFYAISEDLGVQATIQAKKSSESICLNNSFDQLGYGSISIRTLPNAEHKIAMRIYPEKLRQVGYRIVQHYDQFQERKSIQKNYVLVSSKGRPEIIILQKLDRLKKDSTIGTEFPPAGTVQFLRITPLSH